MYGMGEGYSPAVESAAFKQLHTLSVALGQLKAQGNTYGVHSLLPYYRAALETYRASGDADPAYLSQSESLLLSAGTVASTVGSGTLKLLDTVSQRVLIGGALVVAGLFLWNRRR